VEVTRVDPFKMFSTRINLNTARAEYWTGSAFDEEMWWQVCVQWPDSQTAFVQNDGPMRFFHISAVVSIPDRSLASLVKIPV
jgi:hypothetical protein